MRKLPHLSCSALSEVEGSIVKGLRSGDRRLDFAVILQIVFSR